MPGALRVRMGLHTGEAERPRRRLLRPGAEPGRAGHVRGPRRPDRGVARHRGARARHAAPTRSSSSISVSTGCATSRRPSASSRSPHADLRREFPRAALARRVPGNLPVQLTSFVGRDDERRAIVADALARLAAGDAHRHRRRRQDARSRSRSPPRSSGAFADGAWFCELASATTTTRWRRSSRRRSGACSAPACRSPTSIVEYLQGPRAAAGARQLRAPPRRRRALAEAVAARLPRRAQSSRPAARRSRSPASGSCRCVRSTLPVGTSSLGRARGQRAGAPVRRSGREAARPRLRARRATVARGRRDLPAGRRHPARDRARRRPGRVDEPADIAAHLDERFRLLTGKRRGRGRAPPDVARRRSSGRTSCSTTRERTVFDRLGVFAGTFDADAAERGRRATTTRRRGRCSTPSRAWWRSRCSSPTTGPTAPPATRCSRRCGSSPANNSTSRRRRPMASPSRRALRGLRRVRLSRAQGSRRAPLDARALTPSSKTSGPRSDGRSIATNLPIRSWPSGSSPHWRRPRCGHSAAGIDVLAAQTATAALTSPPELRAPRLGDGRLLRDEPGPPGTCPRPRRRHSATESSSRRHSRTCPTRTWRSSRSSRATTIGRWRS